MDSGRTWWQYPRTGNEGERKLEDLGLRMKGEENERKFNWTISLVEVSGKKRPFSFRIQFLLIPGVTIVCLTAEKKLAPRNLLGCGRFRWQLIGEC